jgi:hypothetical protein
MKRMVRNMIVLFSIIHLELFNKRYTNSEPHRKAIELVKDKIKASG